MKCNGQKPVFSLVKAHFDESIIVQVLISPPVLHHSRAYVNLIPRGLWDTCLNPKGFWLTHSSEIVRYYQTLDVEGAQKHALCQSTHGSIGLTASQGHQTNIRT